MLDIFFYLTGKSGKDSELRALLGEMTRVSRADDGCIHYTFHQQLDDRRKWVLHEQWRDRAALDAHIASMKKHFGEPPPGARLPQRLHELHESSSYAFHEVLA
ncbi:MAG TPA: putative quinol monooxygenase [Nevskiaceae bacterium]|nr:putative quinol monooxygenase [Nevskiaceae bacterium]